jgi:hypothetical protein
MTERKWAPTHGQGSFSDKSEYEAYLDGYCEAIAKTAAHDLYDALKAVVSSVDDGYAAINIPLSAQARTALAKARGE